MGKRIQIVVAMVLSVLWPAAVGWGRSSADVSAALNVSALRAGQTAMIAVVLDIHPGLHAQSHTPLDPSLIKLEVTPEANTQVEFGEAVYPAGQTQTYPAGTMSVYTGRAIVYLPVKVNAGAPVGPVTINGKVTLQACDETSCFAPEHPSFSVASTIVAGDTAVTAANAELFAGAPVAVVAVATPATQPSTQPVAGGAGESGGAAMTIASGATTVSLFGHSIDLSRHGFLLAAVIAFLAGIIFNVVPCVLPVLPVKAVGFYEASRHSRARSLLLGFVFSAGLVALFAALGMVVLLSKTIFGSQVTWGQQFSHPWFVWGVAIVLGALGFGMLGAFSARLPTSIYGLNFRHDTLSGNFLWGALTAVLSTPCTAPLFPPVLGFALTLPKIEGFSLVAIVGCGMASPYLLLSAFPEVARRFPRTGAFADLVKQMMGFLMLGSAAFFAGLELVGEPNQWWVVFAVLIWACLYLVVRTVQISKSALALQITTAIAVAAGTGGLVLCLRLTDALPHTSAAEQAAQSVQWKPYSESALAEARASGKPVIVDFTANWCLNCKYVETTVYHDPRTLEALKKLEAVTLKADLTTNDAAGWPLLNQLQSNGIPFTAVYLPGAKQPVGLASIYTTDTLLHVLGADAAGTAAAE